MTSKKNLYLSRFRNKTFVLKIGGEVVENSIILKNILKDIKNLLADGIKIILVHGGGKQADDLSKQIGHIPVKIKGRRVTQKQDLEIAKMLYGGSLNLEILSTMKKLDMKGIRVSGLDGNLLDAKIRGKKEFDYGYVGDIKKVNPHILLELMKKGYMPIISPLASTKQGIILNINADTIAAQIALSLQAEKLILFTNTDGVYEDEKLLKMLTIKEAKQKIVDGVIKDGMEVKISTCISAIKGGIKRVHIINGLSPHSLLTEVLTKKGIGTMIISDQEKLIYSQE